MVPHRVHARRTVDAPGAPGSQPDPLHRLLQTVVALAASALIMLLVLVGAIRYLQRDWADKNQRARSHGHPAVLADSFDGSAAVESVHAGPGRRYVLPAKARERFFSSLAGHEPITHFWLLQSSGPGLDAAVRRKAVLLDLAENGDGVRFRNLQAALLLRQGAVPQAVQQLRLAEGIEAGYPPTIFNRALSSMMGGHPEEALAWIVRYRARFPDEEQAMRFHFNLLLQADCAEQAMEQLDRFLSRQPPEQPLYLEAAVQAARMGRIKDAIGYLETARQGQPPAVIARIYQSPAFREIRLSAEGTALAERLARRARASLAKPSAVTVAASPSAKPARLPADPKFR